MIELQHIVKRFGEVVALEDVSLRIEGGRVHGLLGENGAGKSTLMNVLFGLLQPDSGRIVVAGREVRVASPRVAQGLGIGMVHQHFKLVPTLSVVENFALSLRTSVRGVRREVEEQMERLRWEVPLGARVEELSVGQQQRVEIVKALLGMERSAGGMKTLILDEPTAVLTPQEVGELFAAVKALKASGTGVVFITHKLAEVQRVCDVITILRRGRHVMTAEAGTLTATEMTEKMVGLPVEIPRVQREGTNNEGAVALRMEEVSAGRMRRVMLALRAGEIYGVAGVDGNGQSDLVGAIVGAVPIREGRVAIGGEEGTRRSIRWRLERVAYIPEDRHRQAVVLPLTVQENLLLKEYREPPYSRAGLLRFGAWRGHARELVRRFDIRTPSALATVGSLSGGNQQKVVLARELHDARKAVVVAVNPTRGLDVGATAFVMQRLLEARAHGAAVLLVHSDLDELLALSDRVGVIYNGRLTESAWPRSSKEEIGRMMLGVAG